MEWMNSVIVQNALKYDFQIQFIFHPLYTKLISKSCPKQPDNSICVILW